MDIRPRLIYLCALLIHGILTQAASVTRCVLPRAWKGRWWQSSLGDVIIKDYSIKEKGVCTEHRRDYYLLYNKESDCYQCLLIIEQQRNLLQYKESYCSDYNTLQQICSSIRVESQLYTLVREPNSRIRCPFHDAYYFNYNDHASGFCDNPLSYAKPCAGQHQYKLHFSHCVQNAIYNEADMELECLATWKAGSNMYLYGKFSGPSVHSKDDAYRCFIYKMVGNKLYMAMSIDPTCRGPRSATDGPIVYTFTKDLHAWPSPSCAFPTWLQSRTWRDVEGQHTYEVENDGRNLYVYYRKKAKAQLKIEFRCMERVDVPDERPAVVILSFSTHRCVSKYQCIKITRKTDTVFELSQGALVDYDGNGRCLSPREYINSQIILLMNAQPIPCPSASYYTILPSRSCLLHLDVGCASNSSISLLSNCSQYETAFHIECMASWHGLARTYIVGRDLSKNPRLYNCFSFRERGAITEFGIDRVCNAGIETIHTYNFRHTVVPYGHCDSIVRPNISTTTVSTTTLSSTTTRVTSSPTPDPSTEEGSGGRPTSRPLCPPGHEDEEDDFPVDDCEHSADGPTDTAPCFLCSGTYTPVDGDDDDDDGPEIIIDSTESNIDDIEIYKDSNTRDMNENNQEGLFSGCSIVCPRPVPPALIALMLLAHFAR